MLPTDPTIPRDIADLQRRTRALETVPRERPWYNVRLMGATGDGVTDDYDAVQTAIAAAETDGGIVYFPPNATYYLNKASGGALKLARDNTGLRPPVTLSGYGATIKLSTNVPRFLDFNKVADHDTFRNIVIEGFEIDADNIGGVHHVIIGTTLAGATQSRINVDRLLVRDVRSYNVLQDPNTGTNHRLHINIVVSRSAAGTGTDGAENTLTNLYFENVRMEGGNAGITVAGTGAAVLGMLIYLDEIHINRCWHDTGVAPTAFYGSVNYQICSRGYGRTCSIRNSYGFNSGDEGIEINAMTYVTLDGNVMEDSWNNAYYIRHHSTLETPGLQQILLRDCHARTVNIASGYGFNIVEPSVVGASPHGTITIEDCSWYWAPAGITVGGAGILTTATSSYRELNIVRFIETVPAFNYSGAGFFSWIVNQFASVGASRVYIRDMRIDIVGQRSGAGALVVTCFNVPGGTLTLDVDGVSSNVAVTSSSAHGLYGWSIGVGTTVLTGAIRRYSPVTTGDSGPYGIYFYGTATLTITDGFFIELCDFGGLGAGGTEVPFASATQNRDKVFFNGNLWLTFPAIAVAITPGASPYTYKNLDGYKETVTISGGTVTVIALSVDGTNFYTTGLIAGAFVLSNADSLKVTYSVAPTMTKLPHKH